MRRKEIPRFCRYFAWLYYHESFIFFTKLPHRTNKLSLRKIPRNFQSENGIKCGEKTKSKPKMTCLPIFLMVTEHMAVQFLWLTNELNRVSQPISIEYKMVHGLNQAVFRIQNFENLAILYLSSF